MMSKRLYTLEEVREIIGGDPPPSLGTLQRWGRDGHLPVVRISPKVIRVDSNALEHFIAVNSVSHHEGGEK